MNIEISLISIIEILSISTAFMLGLLFLTSKSKNNKANVFLGLFMWSLTNEILVSFLGGHIIEHSIIATDLLTLPLLFIYIIKTLNYPFKLLYIVLIIPFLSEFSGIVPAIIYYGFSIWLLLYILQIIKKHQRELGDFYSDIENKTLSWIKNIVYIYLFFNAFWIAEDLIGLKFEFITEYFAATSAILTLVMIYWVGYNGFSQSEIFNMAILATEKEPISTTYKIETEKTQNKITQKKTISSEEISNKTKQGVEPTTEEIKNNTAKIFEQLTQKIKDDKLFIQTDITIRSLSKQLKVNEKIFSKLIKTHTKKNFHHYINQFRVEEFKRLLQTEKANYLSLLGLSKEAGFYSKSTFYSAFKTSEGITPKQYQDQLNKSE